MRTGKILRKIALDMRRAPPVCHVPSTEIGRLILGSGCQWNPRRKRLDEIALNVRGSCTGIIQVYRLLRQTKAEFQRLKEIVNVR